MKSILNKIFFWTYSIGLSACIYNGPQANCVFIGERCNLHNEHYVTVEDAADFDSIEIIKTKGETNKSELIGNTTHFIGVKLLIEHQKLDNPKENHLLDADDFKLKDHTGVQLANMNLFSPKEGLALENKDFSTRKCLKDYTWLDSTILSGEQLETTVYFEISKDYSVENTIMVLECDFLVGNTNGKAGRDIVLGRRAASE